MYRALKMIIIPKIISQLVCNPEALKYLLAVGLIILTTLDSPAYFQFTKKRFETSHHRRPTDQAAGIPIHLLSGSV